MIVTEMTFMADTVREVTPSELSHRGDTKPEVTPSHRGKTMTEVTVTYIYKSAVRLTHGSHIHNS